jgi:hypothetical protein
VAAGNFPNMRWNIITAQGQPSGSKMANIILAHTVIGPSPSALLWNRIDNSDGNFNGQIQLMNPGQTDPHNNWWFSNP